jgi:hypothetical protein
MFRRPSYRKRLLPLAASGAMIAALALGSGSLVRIAAAIIPTPPPVPTPAGEGGVSGVTAPTPDVPVYVKYPAFAGKVLHWTKTTYFRDQASPDPANGRPVIGEMWAQVGADGVPTRFHGRYTFSDGTLHQDIVELGDTSTVVMGEGYPADARIQPGCVDSSHTDPRRMSLLKPVYVDGVLLPQGGFREDNESKDMLVIQPPQTMSLKAHPPAAVYPLDINRHRWVKVETRGGGLRTVSVLETGADGRVLMSLNEQMDATGVTIAEYQALYGVLEVYEPTNVPESVFVGSESPTGECYVQTNP